MSQVLLLDTNVWSHLILSDDAKRTKVQTDLNGLLQKYPGSSRATSGICVAECLVAARRITDPTARSAAEAAFQAEFDNPNLMVVAVSASLLDVAATLRAEALRRSAALRGLAAGADGGKLKLPDAVIAASCLDFDPPAILVTENVSDFCYLKEGQTRTVAELVIEQVG